MQYVQASCKMKKYMLNTPMASFNAYIFDCDGVLIDSNRVKTDAFYNAALLYGEPAAKEFVEYHKANGGISRQKKFEYFFLNILNYPTLPEEKYQKALDDYGKSTAEGLVQCEVLPGVIECLKSLPPQAKKYVVSGGAQDEVRWVLEAKGLATFFDGIYGNPVDKLTLVKNLELKDSDYPGIFFGDARYDHEVAKANGLDFVFLSAVSDFNGWEEYVENHSLPTFDSFTSLIMAAEHAVIEEENNNSESDSSPKVVDEKRKAYFFGFPFSPYRKSNFTNGLSIGPGIVKKFTNSGEYDITLFSSSANYYKKHVSVRPVNQKVAFWESSVNYSGGISDVDMQKFSNIKTTLEEMVERNPLARKRISSLPGYQVPGQIRKMAANKLAFWNEVVEKDKVDLYINSNVPHLADDFACYHVCKAKGIPTAFTYRMPIVPGVSARLYVPRDIDDHSYAYDEEGTLITYLPSVKYDNSLSGDLEIIFNEVVLGNHTLSTLSKDQILRRGGDSPSQYTPPQKGLPFWENVKRNVVKKIDGPSFFTALTARKISQKNKKSYSKNSIKEIPDCPFVYYALHMQPEASSSPLGGFYADQLRAIRFLSDTLPVGWKIIVKEHPHQKLEERDLSLYDDILKSANVEMISMQFSSDVLQQKSIAIATLTGTAAFEAWLKGKPSLVLGNIIFETAPGIYKLKSKDDALVAFEKISSGVMHTQDDIYRYFQYLDRATFVAHLDAYIDPSIPSYQLDLEDNDSIIADRLMAIVSKQTNKISKVY